ncbi:unnamed protein product [Cylicocyclus nassatus]|uniref:Uncharacterized protein n=1 Tax=Cylicocyclus nassatus TaxID=53992 RepID=A0AA36GXK3_CYLNA|nr:unnamed protein product [Cylicocyclus nassatus]
MCVTHKSLPKSPIDARRPLKLWKNSGVAGDTVLHCSSHGGKMEKKSLTALDSRNKVEDVIDSQSSR